MEKSFSILIVDDDSEILELLSELITIVRDDYKITKVKSGIEAKKLIEQNSSLFDLVLSDINMPEQNGVELAETINQLPTPPRLILMSGNFELVDYLDYFFLGVEKILKKPINLEDFFNVIDHPIVVSRHDFVNMIAVKMSHLKNKSTLPFDLYIPIGTSKMIKIFKENEPIDQNRIDHFTQKGVTTLFTSKEKYLLTPFKNFVPIRATNLKNQKLLPFDLYYFTQSEYRKIISKETTLEAPILDIIKKYQIKELFIEDVDHPQFLLYLDQILNEYINSKQNITEEKIGLLTDVVTESNRQFQLNPNEKSLKSLIKSQQSLQNYLQKEMSSFFHLMNLSKKDLKIQAHCTRVASLSFAILLELAIMRDDEELKNKITALNEYIFESEEIKTIIFTGALLHDMGKLNSSDEESVDIKNHPVAGAEKLRSLKSISPISIEIVEQHEEFCDGSGYPKSLKKTQINFFSQVISLANYFDKLISLEKKSELEAIEIIKLSHTKFNKYLIIVLEQLYK